VQLTTSPEDHVMPQISPDNSTVIYHKWTSGTMTQAFTVRAAGGAETQISTPGTYVLFPAYTPDGKQIVFSTFDTNHTYQGISIMNADGTGIKTLTGVAGSLDSMPSVSPDGKTVAFYRYSFSPQGGLLDIYTIGIDGTNLKQLTTDGESLDPLYGKDKIVFISHRDHNGAGEIYSMGLDGSNQKNLTNNGVDEYFFWD
jgi:Tol biopolymer transport system component